MTGPSIDPGEATRDADAHDGRRRFRRIAAAGIVFQGGSTAVDSSTVMAALVHQLTGSAIAVGAVATILRIGWLLPPLVVGYLATRHGRSMPYFVVGSFGRATCIAALATLLMLADLVTSTTLVVGVFATWTAYAFTSGVVAVPYNDIVARSVPRERRSTLLAIRFLGGGVLALAVAAAADRLVANLAFPASYAGIIALAALLMYASAFVFTSIGEPAAATGRTAPSGFSEYLHAGSKVFRDDRPFRGFVIAQWFGGGVMMALPFYVVAAFDQGVDIDRVPLLLAAQTAGALVSNPLWGWCGDRFGKLALLRGVTLARFAPPMATLGIVSVTVDSATAVAIGFTITFFLLGALANGTTIATIGYLMEISPDARRPAYSGYFNALTAPAYLLPLAAGVLVEWIDFVGVFAIAATAALAQYAALRGGVLDAR